MELRLPSKKELVQSVIKVAIVAMIAAPTANMIVQYRHDHWSEIIAK